jgi:threonine synthase
MPPIEPKRKGESIKSRLVETGKADRTLSHSSSDVHQVVLATAHPAKFSEAVTSSLSTAKVPFDFEKDVLPKEMIGLLEKERRIARLSQGC